MAKSIETAVKFMESIAKDDSHGYDQANRNGPDYDCSSLVGTALNKGGFNVSKSSTTRNLYSQMVKDGFKVIGLNETRKRGDVFLKVGHHVVMCTSPSNIVHASINEKGKTTGGKSGDQTGKEICVRSFYNYSGGWDYHLRYSGSGSSNSTSTSSNSSNKSYLSKGDKGSAVKTMQTMLISCGYSCGKYGADGDFGSGTDIALRNFQKENGLTEDGKYGANSKAKLEAVYNSIKNSSTNSSKSDSWVLRLQKELNAQYNAGLVLDGIGGSKTLSACPTVKKGAKGNITKLIQERLNSVGFNISVDGQFGTNTYNAIVTFQKNRGLTKDGVVGKNTWKYLISGTKY